MILVPFLLIGTTPPDLDQKVSIDIRGGTGKGVALELTRKSGIFFETSDAATADRYVIHIESQPLREVMERIADAEHGEWIKINSSFKLRRSPTRMAETIAAHHAVTVRGFQKTLDEYRKQLAQKPDFSDETAHELAHQWQRLGPMPTNGGIDSSGYWEKQNKLQQAIPVGRAFMRILLTFTAEQLADTAVDEPAVFSTRPTAMQRPFPDAAQAALADLVTEQSRWEDAVVKYLPDQMEQTWNGMATNGKMREVTTAIISMQRWDESSGMQAHLLLADQKDHVITETYQFIQPSNDQSFFGAPGAPKKAEPKVRLSDDDIAIAKQFSSNFGEAAARQTPLSDSARAILLNPEKFDPLSTFVADGLIGLATARHENLASVLDDRALSACAYSVSKGGMDTQVLDYLKGWGAHSYIEGNGWLVISEARPDRADEVRCDRADVRKMLDAARSQGRLRLDDAAAFALAEPHYYENPIPAAYLTALLDSAAGRTLQQNDRNLLRFYGSLDSNQRRNSEHLSLGSLTEFQVGLLAKMVYGTNGNLQQTETEPQQPDENGEYFNYWNTLAREPTFSLGSGIPRSGFAKITANNDHAILAHMQYGQWDQGEQTYDVRQLAWMMVSQGWQGDNNQWTVLAMRAADRTQITFEFHYTEKLSQNLSLQDVLPTSKETAFMEKLPDDIRKELQAQIAEAKKQFAQQAGNIYSTGDGRVYVGGGASNGPP